MASVAWFVALVVSAAANTLFDTQQVRSIEKSILSIVTQSRESESIKESRY